MNGNRALSYNKEVEYRAIVKEIESKRVTDLKQKLSDMKNQQKKITIDYLECIINNWWLVKNNPEIIDDLSSATDEYIDQKYSIRKLGRVDIAAGYAYTFNGQWYSNDLNYPIINRADHLSEINDYQSFVLQAEYKILRKELISFLSYINIGLSFSTASAPPSSHDDYSFRQRYNTIDDYNFSSLYYGAKNIKLKQQKYYSLYGKFSIPIFAATPDLILHIGIFAGLNYYTADLSYSYRNTVYSYTLNGGYQYVYLQNVKNAPYEESISRHIFYVSPVVELNLNLLKYILLKFTTSGWDYFSINAGVEF